MAERGNCMAQGDRCRDGDDFERYGRRLHQSWLEEGRLASRFRVEKPKKISVMMPGATRQHYFRPDFAVLDEHTNETVILGGAKTSLKDRLAQDILAAHFLLPMYPRAIWIEQTRSEHLTKYTLKSIRAKIESVTAEFGICIYSVKDPDSERDAKLVFLNHLRKYCSGGVLNG